MSVIGMSRTNAKQGSERKSCDRWLALVVYVRGIRLLSLVPSTVGKASYPRRLSKTATTRV